MKRDGHLIVKKLNDQMEKAGLSALILTRGGSITYATGYKSRGKGDLCVVTLDGKVHYIVSEFAKSSVLETVDDSVCVVSYPVWIFIEDYAIEGAEKDPQPDPMKVFKLAAEFLPLNGKIGIEGESLNYLQYSYLAETFGASRLTEASGVVREAAAYKTPWEIEVLRRNAKASERAMHYVAKHTYPGMTAKEIYDLFAIRCYKELPGASHVSQAHTVAGHFTPTQCPGDFQVRRGDLVRLDGGPAGDGYNSDLGRTFAVGNYASEDKREIFEELFKGHRYQLEHIGPGVRLCDIFNGTDNAIHLEKYHYVRGHYGHSLGCQDGAEEYPFIAPGESRVFEPGMVFCIETPYYSSRHHTYNIEDTILITENGIEAFSEAPESLFY